MCSMASYYWANGGSAYVFFFLDGMVLLLWEVDAVLENRYRI